jgi:hypothetical protein
MILLSNQAVDTTGDQDIFQYSQHNGGKRSTIVVDGVFDGATVSLEIRRPGRTWVTPTDGSFTAPDAVVLEGGIFDVRGAVSGAGGSTKVNFEIIE